MNAASLRQNKWVRRGIVAFASLLGLWLVTWLVVPPIAKSQIQKIASEKLGRKVTVGKIDFKPWTLEVTVDDLSIATADGSQPQFHVARVYADAELQSILRLAPVIDAVRIEAPVVKLTHLADGKYDIDDILTKLSSVPAAPKSDPSRFAVYNIAISGGSVDFNDETVKRTHTLRDLVLNVPFLSNLASKREIKTEPKLAFVLNGSKFDSTAFSTPFADNRKTDARLQFKGLDLVPYLGYIPSGLPVKLLAGTLDADLKIDFEQAATAGLKLSGTIEAHSAKLADGKGRDFLGFDSLKVELADVRPLDRVVHLGEVSLTAPQLVVARDATGQLNLQATDRATGATEKVAPPVSPASAAARAEAPAPGWSIQVDKIALNGGNVGWRDATTQPAAAIDATELAVQATAVTWPMAKAAPFSGSMMLAGAHLKFKGDATDKAATVQTDVEALPLSLAAPYLAQSLEPTVDGKLSGQIDVAWAKPELKFKAVRLALDGLALTQGKAAVASVGRFELTDAEVDMTKHTLAIASFTATNPKVMVERDNEKRWMFERWLKAPATGNKDADVAKVAAPKPVDASATPGTPAANTTPWALTIATMAVDNGAVSYSDKAGSTPVAIEVTGLKVSAQQIAPNTATVSPLQVSGRIAVTGGRADAGRFDYKGNLVLKPLAAEGRVEVAAFPAHAFKAYYADALNVEIRRAYASYRGTVKYAAAPNGMSLKLAGDSALEDFRANSASLTQTPGIDRTNQLLSWKALSLRGLQVTMAPGAALGVDVRETTLTDFFARVIVDPTGRINLQDLTKSPQQVASGSATPSGAAVTSIAATASTAPATGPAPAAAVTTRKPGGGTTTTAVRPSTPSGRTVPAEEMVGGGPVAAAPKVTANPPQVADGSTGPKPIIRFGPMTLVNGRVDFTDQFVKPNYSADLTELTGKLSAFSSQPEVGAGGTPALADLELRGKAEQTASLEIVGKLNPLAKPLELDITGKMRDLDLPPLSPYAVRYAGHNIERGKLSLEVNYKIAPDGRLTATNNMVLNQLQFGDEVQGAPNSLPVRLAVALLADRNGVINVDLPLSGSINDPQFSVGPLIWKALVNLIVKAITSPFSLLTGGLGGGSGESSTITFDAGSSTLSDNARQGLDKVAKALTDRPGLQMTVVGTSSLDKEAEAFKRERLRQLAQAEKRRTAARAGASAGANSASASTAAAADVAPVTDAEYPALLTAVYKRADITKPRNMVGLAKDLPLKEMEDLLMASVTADEETMRKLAVERGAVVRDYLLNQKVPSDRLFLGAVRTRAADANWKPGAELNLATR
ncbi:DUF748 domain-containing protein [soil metagenome]